MRHHSGGARPVLPALQGLRLVAALHVLLVHSMQARWLPAPLRSAIDAGHTSTSLLFLLSGFVLTYVYAGADGRLRLPRRDFWIARFSRTAPLLVLSQLLVLPLWLHAHGPGGTWLPALLAMSGQQAWLPRYAHVLNTPAWAITFLCLAYALFPWLLERLRAVPERRLGAAVAATWIVALLPGAVYHLLLPHSAEGLRALFTFPLLRLPEFVVGMLAGRWFLARGPLAPRSAAAWAAAGLGMWIAGTLVASRVPVALIHNGFFAPAQVVALVGLASGGGAVGALLARRPVRAMGERAYAIFLLHLPLLSWAQALGAFPRDTLAASAAAYAGYLAVTIALSVAVNDRFVDPASEWIRARLTSRPPPARDLPLVAPVLPAAPPA
ncbi:MAG TPA: acyltransferase [Longimicrobium sp.]|nr:acyltransferase [Longimicrobium sp.]